MYISSQSYNSSVMPHPPCKLNTKRRLDCFGLFNVVLLMFCLGIQISQYVQNFARKVKSCINVNITNIFHPLRKD